MTAFTERTEAYNAGLTAAANLHRAEIERLQSMLAASSGATPKVKRTNAWIEARALLEFGIKREEGYIAQIEALKV